MLIVLVCVLYIAECTMFLCYVGYVVAFACECVVWAWLVLWSLGCFLVGLVEWFDVVLKCAVCCLFYGIC